ncbi:hypothetical protein PT7_2516 [Pusillimonas sp. T7-7]|nr:hypothetical protein PT7_2516 [Pusillimonas sp. T7-7]
MQRPMHIKFLLFFTYYWMLLAKRANATENNLKVIDYV